MVSMEVGSLGMCMRHLCGDHVCVARDAVGVFYHITERSCELLDEFHARNAEHAVQEVQTVVARAVLSANFQALKHKLNRKVAFYTEKGCSFRKESVVLCLTVAVEARARLLRVGMHSHLRRQRLPADSAPQLCVNVQR